MRRLLRTLPPRAQCAGSTGRRRGASIRRLSDGKSLEDLVRNKTSRRRRRESTAAVNDGEHDLGHRPPDVAHDLCHEVGFWSPQFRRRARHGSCLRGAAEGRLDAQVVTTRWTRRDRPSRPWSSAAVRRRARGGRGCIEGPRLPPPPSRTAASTAWRGLGLDVAALDGVLDDDDFDDGDPATWN